MSPKLRAQVEKIRRDYAAGVYDAQEMIRCINALVFTIQVGKLA